MKARYQVVCMAFDGEYKRERPEFDTIEDAWNYLNDIGSKWFFYPFCFVVSGNFVRSVPDYPPVFEMFMNRKISTVSNVFKCHAQKPEMQRADIEKFAWSL